MSQSVGQGRWLICFIGIRKVLLAVVLLMISLAALFGDVHDSQLADFADS